MHNCVISWKTSLEHVVALLTTESEYIAAIETVKKAKWLHGLIVELGIKQDSVCVL